MNSAPKLSILIPVYNEETILEAAARAIVQELGARGFEYELILCENGSKDRTPAIGAQLAKELPHTRLLHYHEPNYGGALREGMRSATGEILVCYEIDFWDLDFIVSALPLLDRHDIVIGSKRARGAEDRRPFVRRLATQVFNLLLRGLLGFRGTDTHGLKALRRASVIDLVDMCETDRDVFVTELIVRAQYMGLAITEIPIAVHEIRPAPINIYRRVPRALKQVLRLWRLSRGWRQQSRAAQEALAVKRQAAI
jgi:glycosyltransferase involved in cell wall biosynthesis